MRTYEEYKLILVLWEKERNKKKIAEMTGIPRRTVTDCIKRYGSVAGLEAQKDRATKATGTEVLRRIKTDDDKRQAYSYLLGMYLGDGSISHPKQHRVQRLRVTLDKKYPNIIEHCQQAISTILPDNQVSLASKTGCFDVSCYYKHWDKIFPQHGAGRKHERSIILRAWQQDIVDEYPLEFFTGLYHSDGSRFSNVVKGKDYPRYAFTNTSRDIIQLFCETCDALNLHWTKKTPKTKDCISIFISKRADVERLDRLVGAKS